MQGVWGQAGWEESQVWERQGRDKHQAGGEDKREDVGKASRPFFVLAKWSSTIPEQWNQLGNLGNGHSPPRFQCNRPVVEKPSGACTHK